MSWLKKSRKLVKRLEAAVLDFLLFVAQKAKKKNDNYLRFLSSWMLYLLSLFYTNSYHSTASKFHMIRFQKISWANFFSHLSEMQTQNNARSHKETNLLQWIMVIKVITLKLWLLAVLIHVSAIKGEIILNLSLL